MERQATTWHWSRWANGFRDLRRAGGVEANALSASPPRRAEPDAGRGSGWLTVFTKGEKVRELPIPHPEFWFDLERLILESEAQPAHYLMPQQQMRGVSVTSTARRSSTGCAGSRTSR